ncbi:MAG TPA: DUF2062 domain-containing protein [Acidobacteriota bacterium]|nr:DUF2062 domain-containing protein [Acidobacteriota bacterium]
MRKQLRKLLGLGESPRRTALAYAVGVFLGFSPFLGLHTILGLLIAFFFRLNRVAILLGVYTNNPWWMVPYYAFAAWFGYLLLGGAVASSLPHPGLEDLFSPAYWRSLAGQWDLLVPAFFGSMVIAILLGALAYPTALHLLRRYGRRRLPPTPPKD